MDFVNITPEQAKELIQNAQAEILEQYDEFVDNVVNASIEEWKEIIEAGEKESADKILEGIDD